MKKIWIVLTAVLALLIVVFSIFFPSTFTVSTTVLVNTNSQAAYRYLGNEDNWRKMFASNVPANKKLLLKVDKELLNSIQISSQEKFSPSGILEFSPLSPDSCLIRWTAVSKGAKNPLSKLENYLNAIKTKDNMRKAFSVIKTFLNNEEVVYGIKIERVIVRDTILISTMKMFKTAPHVQDIYTLIGNLENYAKKNHTSETGYPMLNIQDFGDSNFKVMVAIPVSKQLQNHGEILYKQMIPGNILVAAIRGGPYTIEHASRALENYVSDHDLQSPAIPFQSLITNRLNEQDTMKWITKVYYPIY